MKKLIAIVVVLAAVGVGAGAYYRSREAPEPKVTTMPVTRGDVVDAVAATGTLRAVETVDVGTQVSGTVQELYTDFNSIVHKGQVIARLDPSLIQTQNRAAGSERHAVRSGPRAAQGRPHGRQAEIRPGEGDVRQAT